MLNEYCYVMVKPGFANNLALIDDVKNELLNLNLKIVSSGKVLYDESSAKQHYIAKAKESFYKELTDYITSDYAFGIVVKGKNAITVARQKVEELRESLKTKFNLETSLTKNILHCTSKKKIGDSLIDLDSRREINLFKELLSKHNS